MPCLISRRAFAASLAATPIAGRAARAQAFPTRPIQFVVPYAAGGTTDLVARVVGDKVGARLGQSLVIENRGGAGGNIGMDIVAKAAPDGHTIGFGAISTNALNPHLYRNMRFDPRKDFTAISLLGTSTIVLTVGPRIPVRTVAEFIAYAKANPGLTYGTAGNGTSMHLAAVQFAQMTGTTLTHVPYRGSAPAIADMLGGQLGVMFDNLPASLPHIADGKLTALAVAGSTRAPSLPAVPTIAEAGLAGYAVEPWFAVYGPAGLPTPVVAALNSAFVAALSEAEVKTKLSQAGFNPRASSAAELEALTRAEYERFGKLVREAGLVLE
ncbi:Bug family tripartite tricarboxylate transporter substrate binding protein [Phreatobacter sp. AB_2022a]|uniref:Bug family tripartite tricarboxylate transporter substrate binding protein n=1 Tax=Phreatobacter sp. AB_2022a TaxID=3003134 RepID=UPI0022875F64|nr:tripartite tricarboxylate transporter substrate binding protein [Phreatobacter sp. AB_2022a]MCZ0738366.1 tripartite tricarboxylate transporter substrate binding protein [Phreatobacter sp. AB_2022a]